VDRQKEIMKKADAILSEINPVYKEKQETETRFKSIEDSLSEIKSMFKQLAAEKKDDGR
jgi:peptidoglycan hydrolase CwlO-like protein